MTSPLGDGGRGVSEGDIKRHWGGGEDRQKLLTLPLVENMYSTVKKLCRTAGVEFFEPDCSRTDLLQKLKTHQIKLKFSFGNQTNTHSHTHTYIHEYIHTHIHKMYSFNGQV